MTQQTTALPVASLLQHITESHPARALQRLYRQSLTHYQMALKELSLHNKS